MMDGVYERMLLNMVCPWMMGSVVWQWDLKERVLRLGVDKWQRCSPNKNRDKCFQLLGHPLPSSSYIN